MKMIKFENILLTIIPATPIIIFAFLLREDIFQGFFWIVLQWILIWVGLDFFYHVGGFGSKPPIYYKNKWIKK